MPYVTGLNMGITDKVFLSNTGGVTLIDPWIRTDLPTRARADLSVQLEVKNNESKPVKAIVTGTIKPGNVTFTEEVDPVSDTHLDVYKRQVKDESECIMIPFSYSINELCIAHENVFFIIHPIRYSCYSMKSAITLLIVCQLCILIFVFLKYLL